LQQQYTEQQNRSMEGKTHITIDYDGKIIAIETFDEESVEVSTIQNAFNCGEIKGLSYQKDGQKQK
jgi:uncharacterized protein YuzE